jgi:hypothetical protein
MQRLIPALLVLFLVSCAAAGGHGGSSPPAAAIDNIAGQAVSYCWGTRCVDGFPTSKAPVVHMPRSLQIEQAPTELQVFVRRGDGPNFDQEEVAVTGGRLGVLPAGDWDYLLAMARFSSGSAMYAWRLN